MRASCRWVVLGAVLAAGVSACSTHDGFRLIHPPAVADAAFPGGYRLLVKAPLGDWEVAGRFASREACNRARQAAAEDAVVRARARVGDAAKYDLDVRRAVHARCVQTAPSIAPGS